MRHEKKHVSLSENQQLHHQQPTQPTSIQQLQQDQHQQMKQYAEHTSQEKPINQSQNEILQLKQKQHLFNQNSNKKLVEQEIQMDLASPIPLKNYKKKNIKKCRIYQFFIVFILFLGINLWILAYRKGYNVQDLEIWAQNTIESIDNDDLQQLSKLQTQQIQNKKLKQNSIQYINHHHPFSSQQQITYQSALNRVKLNKPQPKTPKLTTYSIISPLPTTNFCILFNSLPLFTNSSLTNILTLFQYAKISKAVIYAEIDDEKTRKFIMQQFKKQGYTVIQQSFQIDVQYQFVNQILNNCRQVAYFEGRIRFNKQQAQRLSMQFTNLGQFKLAYTSKCQRISSTNQGNLIQQLPKLEQINVEHITHQDIAKYIFIFDPKILPLITPLSFAYFTRYSIQQLIIYPLLAIFQGSQNMIRLSNLIRYCLNTNNFSLSRIQFKLVPSHRQPNYLCFISYTNNPYTANFTQFKQYINSLRSMDRNEVKMGLIIYISYNYGQNSLYESILLLLQFINLSKLHRIKLRITANKTLSTHAIYESSYLYCPPQSIIIASRHNIIFKAQFSQTLLKSITQKYHYYQFDYQKNSQIVIFDKTVKYRYRSPYFVRSNITSFKQYFHSVMIFKSDLLKSAPFWIFKAKQFQFYETETVAFVFMMQSIRLQVLHINNVLYRVKQRIETQNQFQEINNIKKYVQFTMLPAYKVAPYKYNCLDNQAYRRNAPDRIQRKLHQIWISNNKISNIRMKLHQTFILHNPTYQILLWQGKDITQYNFPLTHELVQRTLQYQKTSTRSYYALAADLLRYQVLYQFGGIYIDFKMQNLKSLDPFLKYQIFFIDAGVDQTRFNSPVAVGVGIIGAIQNSYYFKIVLSQLIHESRINYNTEYIPGVTGGVVVRKAFTDLQLFSLVGFGYHLFIPKPAFGNINDCGKVTTFDQDQEIFEIVDWRTKAKYQVGIPCKQYPQAYILSYKPLAGTWIRDKSTIN